MEHLSLLNKKVIVFVTMSFSLEGKKRRLVAAHALKEIQKSNTKVVVLENDDLIKNSKEDSLGTRETLKLSSQFIYRQISEQT